MLELANLIIYWPQANQVMDKIAKVDYQLKTLGIGIDINYFQNFVH